MLHKVGYLPVLNKNQSFISSKRLQKQVKVGEFRSEHANVAVFLSGSYHGCFFLPSILYHTNQVAENMKIKLTSWRRSRSSAANFPFDSRVILLWGLMQLQWILAVYLHMLGWGSTMFLSSTCHWRDACKKKPINKEGGKFRKPKRR